MCVDSVRWIGCGRGRCGRTGRKCRLWAWKLLVLVSRAFAGRSFGLLCPSRVESGSFWEVLEDGKLQNYL